MIEQACSNCEKIVGVINWCVDCEGWICNVCAEVMLIAILILSFNLTLIIN